MYSAEVCTDTVRVRLLFVYRYIVLHNITIIIILSYTDFEDKRRKPIATIYIYAANT